MNTRILVSSATTEYITMSFQSFMKIIVGLFLFVSIGINSYLAYSYAIANPALYTETGRKFCYIMYTFIAVLSAFILGVAVPTKRNVTNSLPPPVQQVSKA